MESQMPRGLFEAAHDATSAAGLGALSGAEKMAPMRILLAVDGSLGSVVARDLVAALPWHAGATVLLLSAFDAPADWTPTRASTTYWMRGTFEAVRGEMREQLLELGQPLVRGDRDVEHEVVEGRAADAISAAAREHGVDLIVMGSRGRGPIGSMVLGSVAAEGATQAPCPVLVARHPRVSRMVVATDGSEIAMAIPERLASWQVFRGIPASAVAVSIPNTPALKLAVSLYTLGDKRIAAKRKELQAQYARDAKELAAHLTQVDIPAEAHVRAGDPAHEILQVASDTQSDLVVTGTRALAAFDRLLLGSVARNVLLHAPASVLVMRGGTA
jgi:nucleotide-binding universal stress UspA family protein